MRAPLVTATGPGNVSRYKVPQVRLANAAVSKRINQGILRRVFGSENVDATAAVAQVLQQATKACCWDAEARQWHAGQGLTGCDYQVLLNERGLLSLELIQEFTGAYSYEGTDHLTFDLRTGKQLTLADVVADPPAQLQRRMHGAITRRLGEALRTMETEQLDTADVAFVMERNSWDKAAKRIRFQSDPGLTNEDRATEPDLENFALTPQEFRLYYGPVLPHVVQNLDLDGTYHFPYARVQPRGLLVPVAKAHSAALPKR
ncbi:MAG TPA: hypothetical protein VF629_25735 [Hymenobacter sp.]